MTYVTHAAELLDGTVAVTEHIGAEVLFAIGLGLFGKSGPNIVSFVAASLTVLCVGFTAAEVFNERVGLATALVFGINPIHIYYSAWAYPELFALLLLSLGLYLTLADRYLAAVLVALFGLTFRFEYVLLIQIPVMWLYFFESRSLRYSIVFLPPVVLGALFVSAILVPLSSQEVYWIQFVGRLFPFTVTFFGNFLLQPIQQVAQNSSFYLPHLLYWGVPYWIRVLMNPLLAGLFAIGLWELTDSVKIRSFVIVALFVCPAAVFIYRDFLLTGPVDDLYLQTLALGIFGVIGAILYLGSTAERTEMYLLLATVPYWCLLAISYTGARYILPIMLVFSVYVGFGLTVVLDRIRGHLEAVTVLQRVSARTIL